MFRNYRPELGKWQTADPLGYPDGWNNLAYVNNGVTMAFDWLGGDLVVVVPSGTLDPAETNAVGYWNQQTASANSNPNVEDIHIIEATDVNNARTQLESYSQNNPITDLVFAGHGVLGTQYVGPLSVSVHDNSLSRDVEITSFFQNINMANNPNIELQGCHTGDPGGIHGESLAERLSQITNSTVVAPTGDTFYLRWLTIFGWRYGYESGPTVRFVNGVEE